VLSPKIGALGVRWTTRTEPLTDATPASARGLARIPSPEDAHVNGFSQESGGAASVLDMQVIEELRELGGEDEPGLLREIIGMFLDDAPLRIREIEQALLNGDIKLLERAAHSLKSASANVGAMQLSSVCRRIEEIARHSKSDGIAELIPESNQAWNEAADALRSLQG